MLQLAAVRFTLGLSFMRMNGWYRLWVVAAIIWFCLISIGAWYLRPKPESISHRKEFLAAVSPTSAMHQCSWTTAQQDCEKEAKVVVQMPNGYNVLLAVDDKENGLSVVRSYWRAVQNEAWKQQKQTALCALGIWLIPSIAALLVGHGVAWVRRGFQGR
ncbi:hypothetical protein [Parachitinimonas caeni]|uniref:Uncharacterized protein n=1 Tax=Parachitinimonas caeni TaxID=3031301 RepID=A0ABT7E267_9NEIS|nr:hypothetical protein [Parachitinimonas caeni]MDK2126403.1 hypothetical protein [Parachitinimonas caeni]